MTMSHPQISPEELWQALDAFELVQARHREALASEKAHVSSWQEQRLAVFERLKTALAAMRQQGGQMDGAFLADLQVRVGHVLDGEKELALQVQNRKDMLAQKIQALRKGKKVLRSYGLANGRPRQPRFLSNRT